VVAGVEVTPGSATAGAVGDTVRFRAVPHDSAGAAVDGAPLAWASDDASVATVDAQGLATATGAGAAAITARSGSVEGHAVLTVTLEPEPPPPPPPSPPPPPPPPSGATLLAAGDIAGCTSGYQDEVTADLLGAREGTIAALGDNAYPDGSAGNYADCYDPSWGKYKDRTRPVPGNHEYYQTGAAAYFSYFGDRAGPAGRGYYSYELGSWHIVALNSEARLAEQADWLKADLAAHPATCTLAYWHRPYFTSGHHPPYALIRPLVEILYQAGAEIVLSGHNHQYERFAPQDPDRHADPQGIRQFVVGTGGANVLYDFEATQPNSEVRWKDGYGVLALTLEDGSYSWNFLAAGGANFSDSGEGSCH
jgi:hypothetical protein